MKIKCTCGHVTDIPEMEYDMKYNSEVFLYECAGCGKRGTLTVSFEGLVKIGGKRE